jgi:hypothetical protein
MTLLQEFALRFGLTIREECIYGFYGFISEHDGRLWIWTHSHSPNGHRFVPLKTYADEEAALAELGIEIRVLVALPARPKMKLIHYSCGHSDSRDDILESRLSEREDGTYDYPYLCSECFEQTPEWMHYKAILDRIAAKAAGGG